MPMEDQAVQLGEADTPPGGSKPSFKTKTTTPAASVIGEIDKDVEFLMTLDRTSLRTKQYKCADTWDIQDLW